MEYQTNGVWINGVSEERGEIPSCLVQPTGEWKAKDIQKTNIYFLLNIMAYECFTCLFFNFPAYFKVSTCICMQNVHPCSLLRPNTFVLLPVSLNYNQPHFKGPAAVLCDIARLYN